MAFFRRFAAGLVTGAMLLTTAGAAVSATVVKNTEIKAETTDKGLYKVTFSDSSKLQNGNQYVLLVASFDKASTASGTVNVTIDESTLTFIDQAEAKSGAVSFDVRPKSYPNSLVLLGGDFNGATSPIVIGYINATGEVKTLTLTLANVADTPTSTKPLDLSDVKISIYDPKDVASIKNPNDFKKVTAIESAESNKAGQMDITIPEGTVTVQITREGYLPITLTNYDSSKDISKHLNNMKSCAGDLDGNGLINIFDIGTVIPKLDTNGGSIQDINHDGQINIFDIGVIVPNLDASAATRVYDCSK